MAGDRALKERELPCSWVAIDRNSGLTPEEIAAERITLTLAQVHAALAYYYANKEAMDAEIAAYFDECDRKQAEYMAGKR